MADCKAKSLHTRKQDLESVIDMLPDEVWACDLDGNITFANQAARTALGIASDTAISIAGLLNTSQVQTLDGQPRPSLDQSPLLQAIERRQLVDVYERVGSGNQESIRWVRAVPLLQDDELVGAAAVVRDTTQLYGMRKRIINERNEWRAIFHAVSEGILVTDGDGRILAANGAALSLLELSETELLGQLLGHVSQDLLLTPTGSPIERQRHFFQILQEQGSVNDYQCKLISRSGRVAHVIISGISMTGVEDVTQHVFTIKDVTELRAMEEAKDRFLQLMSHELRNPLQVITAIVDLMRLQASTHPAHKAVDDQLERLDQQVDHLVLMVNEMLTAYLSRTDAFSISLQSLNIIILLEEMLSTFAASAAHHQITFCPPAEEEILVQADPMRLVQVISNLLGNSVKYTPQGNSIWVRVKVAGKHVDVSIEDEGIGIPPERLEQVFTGFYRVQELSEWPSQGFGMGLHISRNIARRHGGDLWAENRPGGGTIVTLRLPLLLDEGVESGPDSSTP